MAFLLKLAMAVGLAGLAEWLVRRRRRRSVSKNPAVLVDGTSWFLVDSQLIGPCCDACRVQAMVRSLPPDPEGVALYELCCPQCGRVPVRRAFTLKELLELERLAADARARAKTQNDVPCPTPRS